MSFILILPGFDDALKSLDKLNSIPFKLPVDLAVRPFSNIKDAFWSISPLHTTFLSYIQQSIIDLLILTSNFQQKMKSWKDGRIHKKDFYLITISSDCVIENRQWIFGKEKYVMVNVYMFKNMHDVHFDFSILHIYQVHLCETYNITNKQFQFQTFIRQ